MKLDLVQRWILCNQFQILEDLAKQRKDQHDAKHYAAAQEAVAQGYEVEYGHFSQHIMDDPLSVEDCEEVLQIMAMFRAIKLACDKLTDKSNINEYHAKFEGFDGNEDTRRMTYARFYCETHDAFAELAKETTFNSHDSLSLTRYRRMLAEWTKSANKYDLSKADVVRITNAV